MYYYYNLYAVFLRTMFVTIRFSFFKIQMATCNVNGKKYISGCKTLKALFFTLLGFHFNSNLVDFKVRLKPIFQGFTDSPNLHEVVLCRLDCYWVLSSTYNIIVSDLIRKYLPHSKLKIIR